MSNRVKGSGILEGKNVTLRYHRSCNQNYTNEESHFRNVMGKKQKTYQDHERKRIAFPGGQNPKYLKKISKYFAIS